MAMFCGRCLIRIYRPLEDDMAAHLLATLGVSYASELMWLWGGETIEVPAVVGPEHELRLALGPYGAGRLAAVYGGTRLELPNSLAGDTMLAARTA